MPESIPREKASLVALVLDDNDFPELAVLILPCLYCVFFFSSVSLYRILRLSRCRKKSVGDKESPFCRFVSSHF